MKLNEGKTSNGYNFYGIAAFFFFFGRPQKYINFFKVVCFIQIELIVILLSSVISDCINIFMTASNPLKYLNLQYKNFILSYEYVEYYAENYIIRNGI